MAIMADHLFSLAGTCHVMAAPIEGIVACFLTSQSGCIKAFRMPMNEGGVYCPRSKWSVFWNQFGQD